MHWIKHHPGIVIPLAILAAFVAFGLWAYFNPYPYDPEALLAGLTPEQRERVVNDVEARRDVYRYCMSRLPHEDCVRIYREP